MELSSNLVVTEKLPLDEAMSRVRALILNVKDDLYKITEITQCDLTEDDREEMNDYLENAFGDWQAEVQGSLEEVAYVFGEAASTCYYSWCKRRNSTEGKQPMHIGSVLPNGATVVDFVTDPFGVLPGGVVLCTAYGLSADPFVTWLWSVDSDGEIRCTSGHYFDTLTLALWNFKTRASL